MGILTKMRLAKMKLSALLELQIKVFCKHGFCKAFKLIDSEISKRVTEACTL